MEIVQVPDTARTGSDRPKNITVIGIDGNISSLKTTTLSLFEPERDAFLARGVKIHILYEKIPSVETLGEFYTAPKNAKELELAFQRLKIHQLYDKVEECKAETDKTLHHLILMDRTVYGNYAFTLNNYISGNLEFQDEMALTEQFFMNEHFYSPDYIVYLRTPASQCLEFCKTRDNDYERGMELSYLRGIERINDIMFSPISVYTDTLEDDKLVVDVNACEHGKMLYRILSLTSRRFGKRASDGEIHKTESESLSDASVAYLRGFVFKLDRTKIYRLEFNEDTMVYKPDLMSVIDDILGRENL